MSNETKQTAVEWYANRLCDIEIAYNQGVIDTEVYVKSKTHAYEQAKEIEKGKIIKAFDDGDYNYHCNTEQSDFENGEEYFNEVYGSKKWKYIQKNN